MKREKDMKKQKTTELDELKKLAAKIVNTEWKTVASYKATSCYPDDHCTPDVSCYPPPQCSPDKCSPDM